MFRSNDKFTEIRFVVFLKLWCSNVKGVQSILKFNRSKNFYLSGAS